MIKKECDREMKGKEWAKWEVKIKKMESYELGSVISFICAGLLIPWVIFFFYGLVDNLLKSYEVDMILVAVMLAVLLLTILCFLGGLHCYNKAKEIEEEIECEEE